MTRARVAELTRSGLTPRQVAAALGISVQAVYQHLARLRAEGTLEKMSDRIDRLAALAVEADALRRRLAEVERVYGRAIPEPLRAHVREMRRRLSTVSAEWYRLARESVAEDGGPRTAADDHAETEETGL